MSTAQILDEVNARFYARFADDFAQSRHHGWRGWHALLPLLPSRPLRVLDLGCGNGRLADFLDRTQAQHHPVERYCGRDRCDALLAHARRKEIPFPARFEPWSWSTSGEDNSAPAPRGEYDWVTLFGVMHHVYSYQARISLLKAASAWLRPGGVLSVSFWDFGASERFQKRFLAWDTFSARWGLDEETLEEGDFLLGWSGHQDTPRYRHWVSPQEHQRLVTDLTRDDKWTLRGPLSSGSPDDLNRYVSWRA